MLFNHWYIAGTSKELKSKPLAKTLLNEDIVLFRGENEELIALRDVCPHRNVQLSLGSVKDGKLICAYHGWTFNHKGECTHVPSEIEDRPVRSRCAKSFPAMEQQGYLWVYLGQSEPAEPPPGLPFFEEKGWNSFQIKLEINCPASYIVENFVDCVHTGFVHKGLFRTGAVEKVEACVEKTNIDVSSTIAERKKPSSVLAKLFGMGQKEAIHVDRFTLPFNVYVDYCLGNRRILTISHCAPISEDRTMVYTYLVWKIGILTYAIKFFLKKITQKILLQDKVILESQAKQIKKYGVNFHATNADMATLQIHDLIKRQRKNEINEELRTKKIVSYKL